MEPFDIVMAIVPTLDEKQKQQLRVLLQVQLPPPCARSGHKYRVTSKVEKNWWRGTEAGTRYICEKCGMQTFVED